MITGNEPANERGITIRQHFAAMAMQGFLAGYGGQGWVTYSSMTDAAVDVADQLIKSLNKPAEQ